MVSFARERPHNGVLHNGFPARCLLRVLLTPQDENRAGPRKLGIIGGTFEDGSLTFYAVPDPRTVQAPEGHPTNAPLYGLSAVVGFLSDLY